MTIFTLLGILMVMCVGFFIPRTVGTILLGCLLNVGGLSFLLFILLTLLALLIDIIKSTRRQKSDHHFIHCFEVPLELRRR